MPRWTACGKSSSSRHKSETLLDRIGSSSLIVAAAWRIADGSLPARAGGFLDRDRVLPVIEPDGDLAERLDLDLDLLEVVPVSSTCPMLLLLVDRFPFRSFVSASPKGSMVLLLLGRLPFFGFSSIATATSANRDGLLCDRSGALDVDRFLEVVALLVLVTAILLSFELRDDPMLLLLVGRFAVVFWFDRGGFSSSILESSDVTVRTVVSS